jgi:hypothetical protein
MYLSFFHQLDVNTVILTIVAVILGIQQYRSGNSKMTRETVEAYKAQLELNEVRLRDQSEKLNVQAGQIGKLEGLLKGKDDQLLQYKQIIENRNPDLENVLGQLVHFMQVVDDRLADIANRQNMPIVAHTTITKQV